MRNWSTDLKNLSKYPAKYEKFVLESLINFGTNGKKISRKTLLNELPGLTIDPKKRRFLEMILS